MALEAITEVAPRGTNAGLVGAGASSPSPSSSRQERFLIFLPNLIG